MIIENTSYTIFLNLLLKRWDMDFLGFCFELGIGLVFFGGGFLNKIGFISKEVGGVGGRKWKWGR